MATAKENVKQTDKAGGGELTEAEWAIMKIVWTRQPCAAGTVQEALVKEKGWAYSTVKTTMDRMVNKGLLKIKKVRNLQLFTSQINRNEAAKGEFQKMLSRAFDGALTPLMQFLLDTKSLTAEDLDRIEAKIKSQREKTQKQ